VTPSETDIWIDEINCSDKFGFSDAFRKKESEQIPVFTQDLFKRQFCIVVLKEFFLLLFSIPNQMLLLVLVEVV